MMVKVQGHSKIFARSLGIKAPCIQLLSGKFENAISSHVIQCRMDAKCYKLAHNYMLTSKVLIEES